MTLLVVGFGVLLAASGKTAAATKIPIDQEAEAKLLEVAGSTVGEGFSLKRTAHFVIAYDTDKDTLRDFVARIEATYRAVHRFLDQHGVPSKASTRRLEICFFADYNAFHRYAARTGADATGAAGFYQPASNRAAFYDALSTPRLREVNLKIRHFEERMHQGSPRNKSRRQAGLKRLRILRNRRDSAIETINQLVVQHEVAHQVFFNAGLHARRGDNPLWLVEGLACLFESPQSKDGAGMGVVNQYRLLSFREALAGRGDALKVTPDDYPKALRRGRVVSLPELLTGERLFDTSRDNVESNYAVAWSLVHYLQRRRREDFGVYLTMLAKRPQARTYSPEQELSLFEKVFGPVDEKFVSRWLKYILSQRVHQPKHP